MTNFIYKLQNITRIDFINFLILFYAFTLSFPGEFKRLTTIAIIILWLSDKNRFNIENNKISNIFLIFGIFICYTFMSFLWTNATFIESFDYIRKYWYLLPVVAIYKYMKFENIKLAISLFLAGIFISEVFSYGNYFGIWEIGKGTQSNPTVFMYHTFYSIFLALTSVLLLVKILIEKDLKIKLIYIIFFITVTMNLLINVGRTGQISLILTIMLIITIYFKSKFKYLIYTLLSLILIFILNYNFNSNFNNRMDFIKSDINQILHKNNYTTSIGGRIGFWILSKEIISDNLKNFIVGVGSKQNILIAKQLVDNQYPELSYTKELNHFHSTYLSIITQFGLIGLIIFLYVIYKILIIKISNLEINLVKYTLVSIFLLSSLVEVPFYKDSPLGLFTFFVGVIFCLHKYEQKKIWVGF